RAGGPGRPCPYHFKYLYDPFVLGAKRATASHLRWHFGDLPSLLCTSLPAAHPCPIYKKAKLIPEQVRTPGETCAKSHKSHQIPTLDLSEFHRFVKSDGNGGHGGVAVAI